MTFAMHDSVVEVAKEAIELMDRVLTRRMGVDEFKSRIKELDVDSIIEAYRRDLMKDARLVYYLDALMLLSSLQQEIDFQVAEYGIDAAMEDRKNLKELLGKFPETADS